MTHTHARARTLLTHQRVDVCVLHLLFGVDCNCQDNGPSNLHLPLTQQMYLHTHTRTHSHNQPLEETDGAGCRAFWEIVLG